MTTLKVGIASYNDMKARTMAVERGERYAFTHPGWARHVLERNDRIAAVLASARYQGVSGT